METQQPKDNRILYDITQEELSHSVLHDLAAKCGYPSLTECVNNLRCWHYTFDEMRDSLEIQVRELESLDRIGLSMETLFPNNNKSL